MTKGIILLTPDKSNEQHQYAIRRKDFQMKNLGNILIIGDSYSTFEGYIPEGNLFWYSASFKDETDIRAAEECWWHMLASETGSKILLNESCSGATVCTTERPTQLGTSFVARADRLIDSGFFDSNKVDTVLVLGGTNDSWIDSPVGEVKLTDITEEDKKSVLPAFAYLLTRLRTAAPDTAIVPILNNGLKPEITDGFEEICKKLSFPCLKLTHLSKAMGHPTKWGMVELKDQLIEFFEKL